MIPTLPGTSDIPDGPERPTPTRVQLPTIPRADLDEFEALKKAVQDLHAKVEGLESRVVRLEAAIRIG